MTESEALGEARHAGELWAQAQAAERAAAARRANAVVAARAIGATWAAIGAAIGTSQMRALQIAAAVQDATR